MEFSCEENDLQPLAIVRPRKLSVPRRVQGFRTFTNPLALPFGGQPLMAHGVGVPCDQITPELSMSLRDETVANQILWF
jgi:hypothetical protein